MSGLYYLASIILIVWLVIWAAKNDKLANDEPMTGLFAMKKPKGLDDETE